MSSAGSGGAAPLRTFVVFESSTIDEPEYDADGNPQVPAGRMIMSELRQRMKSRGWGCREVRQHSFYGWAFDIECSDQPTMVLLQNPGPWLLLATRIPSLLKRLWGKTDDAVDPDVLLSLHECLTQGIASSTPRWYTRAEYHVREAGHGSDTPV
jgi:hypothetical protein